MFQKFSKKKSVQKSGSPKSRALRLENLENRELLSVTTFEAETAVAFESQTFAPAPNAEAIDLATLAQGAATETPSLLVTTATDVVDATDGEISLREAIAYSEADATLGGVVTFAASLKGATITLGGSQLEITQSVAIDASALWDATNDAPGLTIDANAASRVFNIIAGTEDAPISLTGLKITGGYVSGSGGGVYLKGFANFADCVFVDNEATSQGGGAYAYGTSHFENCSFESNAAKYGGGLYLRNVATVEFTSFVGNTASYYGGGSYAFNNGMTFANSVWVGNSATRQGGGMFGESATATNCTVAGNVSKVGGGFYLESASTLRNTIVSSNFATEGTPDFYGAFASGSGSNLIGFNAGFNVAPTFDADGVLTNASTVDLRLSATSWAIDRGANEYVASDAATDLDGNARIQAAWRSEATVDVGAYEYGATLTKTPETASAVVTTVADVVDDSDGEISLREAILYAEADASLGGVVTFDSALQGETLVLSGAQLDISRGVKIDASSLWDAKNDAPGLTIDANAKSRIFGVSGGTEAAPVELVALALINGLAADGGAVNASGVVAFENCSIKNNVSSERGGGVYAAAGFATFENCEFVGNVAASNGGGVYIYDDGATEISNCVFTENVATSNHGGGVCARGTETTILDSVFTNNLANSNYGGGAFAYWGETRIENSEFSGNSAKYGGGVYFSSATATLENCSITNNEVVYNGGGVYTSSGETTLTNCAISGNVAGSYGGGVAVSGPTTLENCAIVGNVATSKGGGGVYAYKATTIINGLIAENRTDASGGGVMLRGEATLVNATIAGNEAAVSGGGLYGYNSSASATLSNAIVVDNVATTVVAGADYNVYPNFSTLNAYNVLSTFSAWTNKTEEDVVHYIYDATQPLFTDAENGDYSLAENSQALDKGADALAVDAQGDALTLDLAGKPRFNGTVDVGAYEKPAVPNAPTNLTLSQNKLASAEGTYLLLKWADVADETGYRVEYREAGADAWTFVANRGAGAQSQSVYDFTPGRTYEFRVRAENAYGASAWSTASFTPTAAPTVEVADVASTTFTLNLTAPENATKMRVEVSTEPFATEATIPGKNLFYAVTLKADATSATIKNIDSSATYYVRVRAIHAAGVSDWSDAVLMLAPSDVVFTVDDADATRGLVSWTNNAADATEFRVETSQDGVVWELAGTTPETSFEFTDWTERYVRVRSQNAVGFSAWSQGAILNAPTNLTFSQAKLADANGTLTRVKWNDASDLANLYRVEYREAGADAWTFVANRGVGTQNQAIYDVTPGRTYEFRVRAENAYGASAWSTASFTTLAAPTVEVADVASTTFTLNLTAPENATKMRVEVSTEPFATEATIPGADLTRCATLSADAQTWTPKKLTPGATYYVRVRAINAAGVSDWSEVLELTTPTETLKTSNAVSEAFAELFADDVEDDFWFELESTLGKRK